MGIKKYLVILFAALFIMFSAGSNASDSLDKVSLQLNWKYQFEFAGFIMAKEKGFYADAGLDVTLHEYKEQTDVVGSVLSGNRNYGIFNSSIAIHNGEIQPTILMGTYFQRSPLVLIVDKDIKHPRDLLGKITMGTNDELKNSSLGLMLNHFNINRKNSVFTGHSFNTTDFIEHKVDAISAFRTNQFFELQEKNVEFNVLDPADYGFSTSAINLFTSFSEATNYPERTRRFISASNKGWAYALAHPHETIGIIYKLYSNKKSIEALEFEAEITRNMMLLDLFEIGETNNELVLRTIKQLKHSGFLPETAMLGVYLFEDTVNKFRGEVNFTDNQQRYLQHKKEITLCVDPDWMPFERIKNGKHIGITADVITKFNEQLPIPIKLVQTVDWMDSVAKAKDRQCDIYSLAAETSERAKYMNFTTPYIDLPLVLATKIDKMFIDDIAEVKDKKIGIVKGYAISEILRKRIPDINIVDVSSITEGLSLVEKGELFGYVDNLMVIARLIQKKYTGTLKVSSRLEDSIKLAIGTRNDQPELNNIFEILVNNITEAELQAIYNRWVAVESAPRFDSSLIWKLTLAIFLIALGYLVHFLKLKKLNNQLLRTSTTDRLTGLYNRLKVDELLINMKADIDRYETKLAVILLDIDYFKVVNDKYGHLIGDAVLIEFSNILSNNVREADYVSRWGGEEFLILCPNTGIKEAEVLSEKILNIIRNHNFSIIGSLTASIGICNFPKKFEIYDVLNNVDKALYQSKDKGRNQISLCMQNKKTD